MRFEMMAGTLSRIIRSISIAASTDWSRPVLTGISFEVARDSEINITASDSYILVNLRLNHEMITVKEDGTAWIEAAWLMRWARAVKVSDSAPCVLSYDEKKSRVEIVSGDYSVAAYSPPKEYVGWRNLVPKNNGTEVATLQPKNLIKVWRAADWLCRKNGAGIRMHSMNHLKPCRFESANEFGLFTAITMPIREASRSTAEQMD